MNIKILPSLLSADFTQLGAQMAACERGGAYQLHYDVMDGQFVPNITFGIPVLASLSKATRLPFDVHLMIEQPERYLAAFTEAGAQMINVHVETCPHLHRTIQQIKDLGAQAGVALNPHTPFEMIREILPDVTRVLVMTVNPGFGGQKLIPNTLRKVTQIRRYADEYGLDALEIGVDGGIDLITARAAVEAGADVLIVGNALFSAPGGLESEMNRLREIVAGA
ncbi:MAG: ribulose-phosphate 3-epimerase [Anaerolineae bacterium]